MVPSEKRNESTTPPRMGDRLSAGRVVDMFARTSEERTLEASIPYLQSGRVEDEAILMLSMLLDDDASTMADFLAAIVTLYGGDLARWRTLRMRQNTWLERLMMRLREVPENTVTHKGAYEVFGGDYEPDFINTVVLHLFRVGDDDLLGCLHHHLKEHHPIAAMFALRLLQLRLRDGTPQ